jgi:hypothetical protein
MAKADTVFTHTLCDSQKTRLHFEEGVDVVVKFMYWDEQQATHDHPPVGAEVEVVLFKADGVDADFDYINGDFDALCDMLIEGVQEGTIT